MTLSISTFFDKKERWGFTKNGLVVFTAICVSIFFSAIFNIYDFLAISEPIKAEILVVEGWVPDYVLQKAVDDFHRNNIKLIICSGGPILTGSYLYPFKNYANLTYHRLIKLGVNESNIVAIETENVKKDRTYQSALAFKKWATNSESEINSINILTIGTHARRSRFLFQKALGDRIKVGVIGVPEQTFDPKAWWKYSYGVRTVIDETIAYLYAITFL
jgi:hypothetical protein